jgi:diguanylate cyclase (GGDEF)-like protein/PAS domain S-box-containing protein
MDAHERTIGVLSPLVRGYYFGSVLGGIAEAASAAGYRVVAIQTTDPSREDADGFRPPAGAQYPGEDHIAGYLTLLGAVAHDYIERLRGLGKPVILVSHHAPDLLVPEVAPDNVAGIALAVAHLVGHGHTQIGFVGNLLQSDQQQRFHAYQAALLEHGITPDPALVYSAPAETTAGGRAAGEALLLAGLRSTALVAATDWTAHGLLEAFAAEGLVLPRDQAIIGFDDGEASQFCAPPLTSVRADFGDAGRHAGELLVRQLDGGFVSPTVHLVPSTLTIRESCGCTKAETAATPSTATERREHFRERTYYQNALLTQYAVGTSLLGADAGHATDMRWLAHTNASTGELGLWDQKQLTIAGAYSRSAPADALVKIGAQTSLGEFPTRSFISDSDSTGRDTIFVLPLVAAENDWGWLAVVAPTEGNEIAGRETVNQWAALLTVALDVSAKASHIAELTGELAAMMEASPDAIARYDIERRYLYVNRSAALTLGRDPDQIVGKTDDEIGRQDTIATRWRIGLEQVITTLRTAEVEYSERIDDHEYWFQARMVPLHGPDGALTGVLTSSRDISALKRAEHELAHQAVHDALTGLPNRVLFGDRLAQGIAQLERRPGRLAVLFIDLDSFKSVNDSLGHDVGDRLLVQVAARISAASRRSDTLARFGGDEFVLLCDRLAEDEDVRIVAERIGRTLADPFHDGPHELNISASIGIVVVSDPYVEPATVIRNADEAMYMAKEAGRDRSHMFDDDLRHRATERHGLEVDLRHALARGELRVAYQPLFALSTGVVEGVEALIRWDHPTRGSVSPGDFIPLAEQRGLIVAIGSWVLEEALRQLAEWHLEPGLESLTMSVNLSPHQLGDPDITDKISESLRRHGIQGAHLTLEITETALIEDGGRVRFTLAAISELGVRLALDDFGTGYSSLVHLRDFPVDTLKIDRSFVEQLGHSDQAREIIGALTAMAHFLNMKVVGEGIERQLEWDELVKLGCDDGQGFLVAPALRPGELYKVPGWPQKTPAQVALRAARRG